MLNKSKDIHTNAEVSDSIRFGLDTIQTGSLSRATEQTSSDSSVRQKEDTVAVVASMRQRRDTVKKTAQVVAPDTLRSRPRAIAEPIVASNIEPTTIAIDQSLLDTVALKMDTVMLTNTAVDTLSVSHTSYASNKEGMALPEMLHRSDGIFCLLLFCFFIVAHIYNGGLGFIKENIMLAFSPQKAEKLDSQSLPTTRENVYSYFLVFQAVMLISISIYEGLERFTNLTSVGGKAPFVHIGTFVVLISVFILLKLALNRVVGYIFDLGGKMVLWNKVYLLLISMLGILCFLPTLLLVYSNWWHGAIIGFSLLLFAIMQIVLILRLIAYFYSQRYGVLSLVAYLLTVEILPYIYLGLGLFYFYQIDIFNTI